MRIDKLTTKFQEALADAQSLALGADQSTIDPLHLLVAMLRQDDGPRALLQRAGGNVQQLKNLAEQAMADLPRVQQQGDVQVGSELARLLQASEKEALKRGDQFIASELFLLALADAAGWKRPSMPCGEVRTWTVRTPKASAKRSRHTRWT